MNEWKALRESTAREQVPDCKTSTWPRHRNLAAAQNHDQRTPRIKERKADNAHSWTGFAWTWGKGGGGQRWDDKPPMIPHMTRWEGHASTCARAHPLGYTLTRLQCPTQHVADMLLLPPHHHDMGTGVEHRKAEGYDTESPWPVVFGGQSIGLHIEGSQVRFPKTCT